MTEEREQRRRDLRREAEVRPPLTPPIFEHFDWWAPLLQAGVHYVHVTVPKRKLAEVCATLKKALIEIEATPGRDRCIAEHGQRLARSLTMDRVHAYLADVLRGAAAVQKPKVVQELAEASGPGFVNEAQPAASRVREHAALDRVPLFAVARRQQVICRRRRRRQRRGGLGRGPPQAVCFLEVKK